MALVRRDFLKMLGVAPAAGALAAKQVASWMEEDQPAEPAEPEPEPEYPKFTFEVLDRPSQGCRVGYAKYEIVSPSCASGDIKDQAVVWWDIIPYDAPVEPYELMARQAISNMLRRRQIKMTV